MLAANAHTHTHHFTSLPGIPLPTGLRGEGHKVAWQPLPARSGLPGTPLESQESK